MFEHCALVADMLHRAVLFLLEAHQVAVEVVAVTVAAVAASVVVVVRRGVDEEIGVGGVGDGELEGDESSGGAAGRGRDVFQVIWAELHNHIEQVPLLLVGEA